MHRLIGGILLIFVLSGLAAFAEEAAPTYKVINSQLGPAKITIAQPAKGNGKVLLLAPDIRPEREPLSSDFSITEDYLGALLKEGWLVAATSYRHNGYLLDEGVEDLDQLRAYVIKTYGKPKRLVVAGNGMGGAIALRLAETRKGQYDGALAVSPVLLTFVNKYSYTPKMPLILLCTQDENYEPKSYAVKAGELKAPFPPALWQVNRQGYGKVNNQERKAALEGLLSYCDTGKTPGDKDVTTALPPPATDVVFTHGGIVGTVKEIVSEEYGNVNTNLAAADLERIGLALKDKVSVYFRDKNITAVYGSNYGDVPQGDWIVLIQNGVVQVARSGENAAEFLGCKVGDRFFITPLLKKNNADEG